MATMRDVARRAGVSPMTVSNVVNGHENVRPETRARVLAAITELGYRMNTAARGLRRGRSGIIAIAVSTVASPYEGMISAALAEQVARAGYDPVIELTGHRRAGELDAITHSLLRDHDGLILHSAHLDEHDLPLLRGRHPVVVLSEREYDEGLDQVLLSNVDGRPRRRISWTPAALAGHDRRAQRLAEDMLSVRAQDTAARSRTTPPSWRRRCCPRRTPWRGRRQSCSRDPRTDGIFCATDVLAVGHRLHERGLRVPEDVKVIGFGGSTASTDAVAVSVVPAMRRWRGSGRLLRRACAKRRAEDHRQAAFRLERAQSTRR